MLQQSSLQILTAGRSLIEITEKVNAAIAGKGGENGLVQLFLQHTSASLILSENADPTVLVDLESILSRLAPDGDSVYQHNYEGDDDMAAHVRSVLTTNDISIPFKNGKLQLGTWQGVFLWEHRYQPHHRSIIVSLIQ